MSHGDGAPGAGAEDCITSARGLWRAPLVSRPRRRPTRRRASPAPLSAQTVAGWSSAGRDRWRVKRAAGGMSEDHDRCFSTLVLGAFSTGVFNTNALPRINIGADVWGESSIMTGVY